MEATELVLSNGMRLVCKRTRFLDDELQIKAFAYGGLSELRQEDKDLLLSCRLAPSVAAELGAVGVAPAELLDMMAGKRVSLEMDIGSYTRAFAGECSPNDMEAMMQSAAAESNMGERCWILRRGMDRMYSTIGLMQ